MVKEYFCKLEKKIFIKKTITELIDENGQHITDPSEILLEQQHFYRIGGVLSRDMAHKITLIL